MTEKQKKCMQIGSGILLTGISLYLLYKNKDKLEEELTFLKEKVNDLNKQKDEYINKIVISSEQNVILNKINELKLKYFNLSKQEIKD